MPATPPPAACCAPPAVGRTLCSGSPPVSSWHQRLRPTSAELQVTNADVSCTRPVPTRTAPVGQPHLSWWPPAPPSGSSPLLSAPCSPPEARGPASHRRAARRQHHEASVPRQGVEAEVTCSAAANIWSLRLRVEPVAAVSVSYHTTSLLLYELFIDQAAELVLDPLQRQDPGPTGTEATTVVVFNTRPAATQHGAGGGSGTNHRPDPGRWCCVREESHGYSPTRVTSAAADSN